MPRPSYSSRFYHRHKIFTSHSDKTNYSYTSHCSA
jgi:hypothetical protein